MRGAIAALLVAGSLATLATLDARAAAAQVRGVPPTTVAAPPRPTRPDSTRPDTTKRQRELVKWAAEDSVMRMMLTRPGYTATRYQGDNVALNAKGRELTLSGKAAVERGQTILVGDTLVYNDSTRQVFALGDTIVVRDPTANAADIVAYHKMTYDLNAHSGIAEGLATAVTEGQTWYVESHGRAKTALDTSGRGANHFYVLNGTITSCDLVEPHYHFQSREIKLVSKNIMIARPAVLYIADIPVLWLPFVFQDMRSGRRSGVIPPRFGLVDIVRTSPTYRRTVENLGYYFDINDYTDALVSVDWRSGAKGTTSDPGWWRYNGEFRYRWLERFLGGSVAATHSSFGDGSTNTALNWNHQQDFSATSHLTFSGNYVSNTQKQLSQALSVAQVLASIASSLNLQNKYGPAQIALGGTRHQYVGRAQVDQTFPTLSLSTEPVSVGKWLVWTPQFSLNNSTISNSDAAVASAKRFFLDAQGRVDSSNLHRNSRNSSAHLGTPFKIFDYDIGLQISADEQLNDFPEGRVVYKSPSDTLNPTFRVFDRTYTTRLDFTTSFGLPHFSPGRWNISPSLGLENATQGGFLVRTERTGGRYVSQSKRPSFNVGATPTFFGLFPGFGPFSRIRHSINTQLTFNYAPDWRGPSHVSDDFLQAIGMRRVDYDFSAGQRVAMGLGIDQVFEAKVRAPADSAPEAGEKIRLLTLHTDPLQYDFQRARTSHRTGLLNRTFSIGGTSDLLPGFDVSTSYSLFEGNPESDSARFSPYRTDIRASFHISRDQNPLTILARLLGHAPPPPTPLDTTFVRGTQQQPFGAQQTSPFAGTAQSRLPLGIDEAKGWDASLTFSSSRQRPPKDSSKAIYNDPTLRCNILVDPIARQLCINSAQTTGSTDSLAQTTLGGYQSYSRPLSTLQSSVTFNLTPKWAAHWSSSYDFERGQFSDHTVTLQRDLHDWRAIFAFIKAPNGNFAFTFFIALKAEPDLKFNYDRRTYRPVTQ
ncbi:MAG: putative LPS assembly protein LptD [Gemmatimonadaceae bacterium]